MVADVDRAAVPACGLEVAGAAASAAMAFAFMAVSVGVRLLDRAA
jgi:hypothetical protein